MSVWSDMHKRSVGHQIKKEDKEPVFFKFNSPCTFEYGEEVIFNKGKKTECIGEYITSSRISRESIFRLVEGKDTCLNDGLTYSVSDVLYQVDSVGYVHPITEFMFK